MGDHKVNTTRECTCCGAKERVYRGPAGNIRVAVCAACDLTPSPAIIWPEGPPPTSG